MQACISQKICLRRKKEVHAEIQQEDLFNVKMLAGGITNCCVLTFFSFKKLNRTNVSPAETLLPKSPASASFDLHFEKAFEKETWA